MHRDLGWKGESQGLTPGRLVHRPPRMHSCASYPRPKPLTCSQRPRPGRGRGAGGLGAVSVACLTLFPSARPPSTPTLWRTRKGWRDRKDRSVYQREQLQGMEKHFETTDS